MCDNARPSTSESHEGRIEEFDDCVIVNDEDLRSNEETDEESVYDECDEDDDETDATFYPVYNEQFSWNPVPLEYKAKAVAFAKAHPKHSLKSLQRCGFSRLRQKVQLKKWAEDVKKGGTRAEKLQRIDAEVLEKFKEARACQEEVTPRRIKQWAMAAASPYLSEKFLFRASGSWVQCFKNKHGISQRRIAKSVSKADAASMDETVEAAEQSCKRYSVRSTFSPQMGASLIATGSDDGSVQLLDAAREGKYARINDLHGHAAPTLSLSFNYDESLLVSADQQGLIIVWRNGQRCL